MNAQAPDDSIVGSVLALCKQTPGARRGSGPITWRNELRQLQRSGFTRVDLLDSWVPFADITTSEIDDLGSILGDLELSAPCLGTSRRSLIHPEQGEANLDYTLRIVQVAHQLGLSRVGIGFHPALVAAQRETSHFWEHAGPPDERSAENWAIAAERVTVVCDAAAQVGIDVNIELYEDSLFSTGDDAIRLVDAVNRPNFGVNPDLGNLIRAVTPLRESWLETFRGCLPYMTYWHLKNYSRATLGPKGPFSVAPTGLGDGAVDYRIAIREALASGYTGPFVVEHYGGDALWMQEQGAVYLHHLVDQVRVELQDDTQEAGR